jgi:quercetin dioxygenase-like cupin family protein
MKVVEKGWGRELWIHNDEKYCGKLLFFKAGKKCSLHYHVLKHETFYVQSGRLWVKLGTCNSSEYSIHLLTPGMSLEIAPGVVHQMTAIEDVELFEFSTQHFDEDSYRLIKGD